MKIKTTDHRKAYGRNSRTETYNNIKDDIKLYWILSNLDRHLWAPCERNLCDADALLIGRIMRFYS